MFDDPLFDLFNDYYIEANGNYYEYVGIKGQSCIVFQNVNDDSSLEISPDDLKSDVYAIINKQTKEPLK